MWHRLEHAYGPATDVPGLLAQVRDPLHAGAAISELNMNLYCDGRGVYPAVPAALPALVDLAEDPAVAVRPAVVDTIGDLAHAGRTAHPRDVDPGWAAAWARAVPRLLALLRDEDVEVRRAVTFPLAQAVDHADVPPALRARFAAEPDRSARLGLVVAHGRLPRGGASWPTGLLDHEDPAVRVAAVVGLRRAGVVADAHVALLRDPGSGVWDQAWWVRTGGAAVVWWLSRELREDRAARTRLMASWLPHPDPQVRAGALLACAHPVDGEQVLPLVADRLADEEPENRRVAATLLARARAPYADDLALAARDAYLPAADAALTALAALGDERAVAPLLDRLTGPRLGLSLHRRADEAWRLPLLEDVLAAMRPHAAALLPALRDRLRATADPVEQGVLIKVFEDWQQDHR
ncbi:hypothetical protein Q5530_20850 [Saccharothrix sp. BKS2]|uniref:HEAT repeat domain-containing protein n=1 Tax=Saccharothrix sp. BKS2 TaxID=3064400 RepID=UPI0039E8535D